MNKYSILMTDEGCKQQIESITKQIQTIASIPGNYFNDSFECEHIIKNLSELKKIYEMELKSCNV